MKMVYCVYSLEPPRWGDSNEHIQQTLILKKKMKIYLYYASCPGAKINTN